MSWDADLIATDLDGNTYGAGEWNYTHNTNRMVAKVLETIGTKVPHVWFDGDRPGTAWFMLLDEQSAKESLNFLDLIIGGLCEAPAMFREMNPENSWGDYDSFLAVLKEMRDCAASHPSATWRVSG